MRTTTFTIRGISAELLPALHGLFQGSILCSKTIKSAKMIGTDPTKLAEWIQECGGLPIAKLKSSQYNNKQNTYTVEIEMLCDCILEDVVVAEQSINYGRQLAKKLRFRPSNEALLLIYATLGLLDDTDQLEAI